MLATRGHIRTATPTDRLLYILGFRHKFFISGHSMYPMIRDGSVVFVKKEKNYNVGDIVIAEHPFRKMRVVKMIIRSADDSPLPKPTVVGTPKAFYELRAVDPIESEDSASFGAIAKDAIVGKVVATQ